MNRATLAERIASEISIRTIAKEFGKSPTSIRYWLNKYGLKSELKAKHSSTHLCGQCGENNPEKFYGNKKNVCGTCHNKYTQQRGKDNRKAIIAHMGGCCRECNFDRFESSLELHHLDPSQKDRKFNGYRGWRWERILAEIAGCVLLCSNCHRAVHSGELQIKNG